MQGDERLDKEVLNVPRPRHDLLVTTARVRSDRRQLQPIERALPRQRTTAIRRVDAILTSRILLADQHRQQRIAPQGLVVVEVFIPQTQPEDPLLEQIDKRMCDLVGIPMIVKAVRKPLQQPSPRLDLAEQHSADVRGDRSASEFGDDVPPAEGLQLE